METLCRRSQRSGQDLTVMETANSRPDGAPSPEQIRARCLVVQAGWTEKVRHARKARHAPQANMLCLPYARIYIDGRKP